MLHLALQSTLTKSIITTTLVSVMIVGSITPSFAYRPFSTGDGAGAPQPDSSDSRKQNTDRQKVNNAMANLPIAFEANHGQVDNKVRFFSRGRGYALYLTQSESVLALSKSREDKTKAAPSQKQFAQTRETQSAVISMKLVGANSKAFIEGTNQQPASINYFTGQDRKKWRTGISSYAQVKYHQVYSGIDLVYYGKGQQLEYDLVVAPGADPRKIRMQFKGVAEMELSPSGDLVLHTPGGEVRHRKPYIYQEVNGPRKAIEGRFVRFGKNQVGFEIGTYDSSKQLVIDPAIVYSTFLGGGSLPDGQFGGIQAKSIAIHTDSSSGNTFAYVAGTTEANGFPTKNALYSTGLAFVAKLNMTASGDASLVYSTFIGKNQGTTITFDPVAVAVDSAGNAYLTGNVQTNDFPVVNAFQTTNQGPFPGADGCGLCRFGDGFIMKLNADGNQIIYSTYLGGTKFDVPNSLAVDAAGNAYITGYTSSSNFPVVNAYQATNNINHLSPGAATAFVSKIVPPTGGNPAALVYSTYLGGSGASRCFFHFEPFGDLGNSIAVDSAGNAYVTGDRCSGNFPITANAFKTTGSGFMAKLNPSVSGASSLVYSTALGSVQVKGIAVDSAGNAYVTGFAYANDFATTPGAFQPGTQETESGFVMKIDPSHAGLASLIYSTYVGGPDSRIDGYIFGAGPQSISVDATGNAFITGTTYSAKFPLVNPAQSSSGGVLQSIDGGNSFNGLSNGLAGSVQAVAIDTSTVPRTLYAGTPDGVFKSNDGGVNWISASNGLAVTDPNTGIVYKSIYSLVINPHTPSTIYAGGNAGTFKSTDGGQSWIPFWDGQSDSATLNRLALDTTVINGQPVVTIYAATNDGLYKLIDGSSVWTQAGLNGVQINNLAIDSNTSPHTLYITSLNYAEDFKSTDGGSIWQPLNIDTGRTFIAIDSQTTPSTLYAIDENESAQGSYPIKKSVDGGSNWEVIQGAPQRAWVGDVTFFPLMIDETTTPSTIYISGNGAVEKSADGGLSWSHVLDRHVWGIAIDIESAPIPTLYVGTTEPSADVFIAELNPTGSALLFSTYLGGISYDSAKSIAVDSAGNIYVVGYTDSKNFPAVNAFQDSLHGNSSAFITKLGSVALPQVSATSVTTQVAVQTGTLELTFPNITGSTSGTSPTTTVSPLDSTGTANLTLSNNLGAYEITTTATYDASAYASDPTAGIKLSFTVPAVNDESVFNGLVITHGEDQNSDGIIQANEMIPYNGTVDPNKITHHDFASRAAWVYVPSLSPFVIVKGAPDQFADLVKTVKTFNLKAGIQNSLDAKLQKALTGYQAAVARDRATACNQMGSFISEVRAQTSKALTQAQAEQLIGAAQQIKVVLGCR